jgi:hypothetical protein
VTMFITTERTKGSNALFMLASKPPNFFSVVLSPWSNYSTLDP